MFVQLQALTLNIQKLGNRKTPVDTPLLCGLFMYIALLSRDVKAEERLCVINIAGISWVAHKITSHFLNFLESNGIRNRDMIRQHRKKRLTELMEYTKNAPDPGRYGEVLCLLTPLYEVSLEVTEQLRLEQYVNEGEARIDAHLLMSMINDIDYEMPLEASIH